MKLIFVSIILFSVSVFGNSLLDHKWDVKGYDEQGNKVRCESLHEGDSCQIVNNDFTNKCSELGHRILYCSDCTTLCSDPVN